MKKGYIFCLLAACCLGTAPTALNIMINMGISDCSGPFYSSAVTFVLTLVICLARRMPMRLPTDTTMKLGLAGMIGMGGTTTLLALSYNYISAGTSIVINFLYPTFVTLVSIIFFKHRASKFTFPAMLCSIVGMAFISLIGGDAGGAAPGYLFALGSAITYTFYLIANERFNFGELPPLLSLCYINGAAALMMFVRAILTEGKISLPATPALWALSLVYCLLTACGFLFLNMGVASVGAVEASFATLVEPVVSVISSTIFLKSPLTITMLFGFVLILAALWMNSTYPPTVPEETSKV